MSISLTFCLLLSEDRIRTVEVIDIDRVPLDAFTQHGIFVLLDESELILNELFEALKTLLANHIEVVVLDNVLNDLNETVRVD